MDRCNDCDGFIYGYCHHCKKGDDMKGITIKLTPVECLAIRHCLKLHFEKSTTHGKDKALEMRIYYRIDEEIRRANDVGKRVSEVSSENNK